MLSEFPYAIQHSSPAQADLAHVRLGAGSPLVLVHGSLCDLRYWKAQMQALARDFLVFSISLPGYWPDNGDGRLTTFSAEAHADALAAFIGRHCGGRANVVGHSRGGRVAFDLARRHADKVQALVLADPGLVLDESGDRRDDFRQRALRHIEAGDIERGLALFVDTVSGKDTWRRMVPWFRQMAMDNASTLFGQVCEAPYLLTEAGARALDKPVLLVGGALSPPPYPDILAALHDWLPDSQYLRIPGSSHGMNLGNPRAFNEAVRRFLAQ
jgi:pimeloyl-ACP methyl ester carboxylesterase